MSIETKQPVTQIRPLIYENYPPIRGLNSWRTTVSAGAVVASFVLIVNLGVLVWVRRRFGVSMGFLPSSRDTLWPDLAINIMSTLLLGARNSCAQLLSSPSRRDIDIAHIKGKWLDVGVPSVRNLGHIVLARVFVGSVISKLNPTTSGVSISGAFFSIVTMKAELTSLSYSPVIFSTLSSVDDQAALVTQHFLKEAASNDTELAKSVNAWSGPGTTNVWQLKEIQAPPEAESLTRLANPQYIQAYQNSLNESSWKNLLLITSVHNNNSIIRCRRTKLRTPGIVKTGYATAMRETKTTPEATVTSTTWWPMPLRGRSRASAATPRTPALAGAPLTLRLSTASPSRSPGIAEPRSARRC
ncbi:hypothetical protein RB213_015994 [Colletotrichum asianum]